MSGRGIEQKETKLTKDNFGHGSRAAGRMDRDGEDANFTKSLQTANTNS